MTFVEDDHPDHAAWHATDVTRECGEECEYEPPRAQPLSVTEAREVIAFNRPIPRSRLGETLLKYVRLCSQSEKGQVSDQRRDALIRERGLPTLRLEFDVFEGGKVSMWTHLDHGSDFGAIKSAFVAVRDHLDQFIRDGAMCPFSPQATNPATSEQVKAGERRNAKH